MPPRPLHRRPVTPPAAIVFVLCLFWHVTGACADELTEFEHAREAYEGAQYRKAIERFEALVGGDTPRLRSTPLVLESRKYLAASYLFAGKAGEAEAQFESLLRADPGYQLDPVAFPEEVRQLFDRVRERIDAEQQALQADEAREAEQEAQREAERERLRARVAQLEDIAREEVVRQEHSRWVAMIPFGVGQFQNGHQRLGLTLAITQGIMAATALTSFLLHRDTVQTELPGAPLPGCPTGDASFCERLNRRERAYRYTNWISTGLLGALVIYGLIDAQLRFVPHREATRPRERPAPEALEPEVRMGVGLGSVQLRVEF
jgi:tetratricopeptide (TPR) repeat protein